MKRDCLRPAVLAAAVALCLVWVSGCGTTSKESAERDTLTEHVGVYPPAPTGIVKPRVGVPLMDVKYSGGSEKKLETLAADQMNSLLFQTGRFIMLERTQIDKVLGEQNMEGIVRPDQLAKAGQALGAQYILAGKVTNLRVKAEKSSHGFGIARIPVIGVGGFDYKQKSNKITAECGVDIRLVDTTTSEIVAAHFGEFKRIDTIEAFGVDILGASAEADASLQISDDDRGKLLRLALDEALRKMIPAIDQHLVSKSAASPAPAPAAPVAPTPAAPGVQTPPAAPGAVAEKKFCSSCGKPLAPDAKFCAGCGAKVN